MSTLDKIGILGKEKPGLLVVSISGTNITAVMVVYIWSMALFKMACVS